MKAALIFVEVICMVMSASMGNIVAATAWFVAIVTALLWHIDSRR